MIFAIFNLSTVAVLWFGAIRVEAGDLSIGDLTAFLQYLIQILFAVLTAVFMFILIPRAAVSSGRIREVLETEPIDPRPGRRRSSPPPTARPRRRRVPRRRVPLPGRRGAGPPRHLVPAPRPGETTAIVGSTGSGKSTLINLIPRFYDATAGTVLVDGVDVQAMDREDLWARIGFIPQKAFLFSGTVASNLRFGDADGDRRGALAGPRDRPGQATSSSEMEGGLEAPITQGGTNVSGGQRQRLAIARALVEARPDLRLRRQLLARSTSRPTRGSGPRSSGSSATRR